MILADIANDISLIENLPRGAKITLKCSFTSCENIMIRNKGCINAYLKQGSLVMYCSSKGGCRLKHNREQVTVSLDAIDCRVCDTCKNPIPFEKMGSGGTSRSCAQCKGNQPNQKFSSLRSNAKCAGVEWSISFAGFVYFFWQKPCTYCDEEIKTVGLDRVVPNVGYVLWNVVPCCPNCNIGKSDGTVAEFLARCKAVAERHGPKKDV